ncbi:hypothetical protein AXK11_03375 [Cephaloticoccus primus]|uniref:YhcH/YjgK/YiaL family protein n=1 Tax=Cephaloticoccus primus TaxID=1548207 RepID=A0A139SQG0_9BACT|nr:YhcH/YjgK/YiaL family protein [Cephaloticoccus primus]KXU36845.1 hypothetical protein AXK11_03375 [Cephaloticoccus primus]
MAVFGSLDIVREQTVGWAGFAEAFRYVESLFREDSEARAQLFALQSGESQRQELAGGVFAIAQVYEPRERYGVFESHRRYHDIQVIVAGEERAEVADIEKLGLTQPYDAEKDFALYADTALGSGLRLRAGDVAVFAPRDGHMPGIRASSGAAAAAPANPERVYKVVVKVPVSDADAV